MLIRKLFDAILVVFLGFVFVGSSGAVDVDQNGLDDLVEPVLAERFKPSFILNQGRICEPEPVEILAQQGVYFTVEDLRVWATDNIDDVWDLEFCDAFPSYCGSNGRLGDANGDIFTSSAPGNPFGYQVFYLEYGSTGNQSQSSWENDYLNEALPTGGKNYAPTVYAHFFFDGAHWVIQYWVFYPYNGWVNDHEGDWEHINVVIDYQAGDDPVSSNLLTVDYRFHHFYVNALSESAAYILDDTHPIVFVGGYESYGCAFASHSGHSSGGSYPAPGLYYHVGYKPLGCPSPNDQINLGGKYIPYDEVSTVIWPKINRIDKNDSGGLGSSYFAANPETAWMRGRIRFGHFLSNTAPGLWEAVFGYENSPNRSPLNPPYQDGWETRNPSGYDYFYPSNEPISTAGKGLLFTLSTIYDYHGQFPGDIYEYDLSTGIGSEISRDHYRFTPDNSFPSDISFAAPEFVVSDGILFEFNQWSTGDIDSEINLTLSESSSKMYHHYAQYRVVTGEAIPLVREWNGGDVPMQGSDDAATMCPNGDKDELIIEIDFSSHPMPYEISSNSIRIGQPMNGRFKIWDEDSNAESNLSAANGWKTEIVIDSISGCGEDLIPVFIPNGLGDEIVLDWVRVYVRSIDISPDGTVGLDDYGPFGIAFGNCGTFECSDFNQDGCVEIGDFSIFGQHFGHSYSGPKSISSDIGPLDVLKVGARLMPCRPNPFNPSTTIEFALGKPGNVKLGIYDLNGKLVRELVSTHLGEGSHQYVWNGNDRSDARVASGVYFYRLVTQDETLTKRMMLLK